MGQESTGTTWFIPSGDPATEFFWAAVPGWVAPSGWAVSDCYWLAYRAHVEDRSGMPGAAAATLAWVCGGATGPITCRLEQPVTTPLVRAEISAAWNVGYDDVALPLERICADLGVAYYPVQDVSMAWADRVWRTLQWLRGPAVAQEEIRPPVTLPARTADGAVATAEELYAAEIARDVAGRYEPPERQLELRLRMEQLAARSRELDRIVTAVKRAVGVAV